MTGKENTNTLNINAVLADIKKKSISTVLMSKRRLILVVALSMLAGIPIGQYWGSTEQLQSDEQHIKDFAQTGTPLLIGTHLYNISLMSVTKWSPGLDQGVIIPYVPQEPATYNIAPGNRTVNGE